MGRAVQGLVYAVTNVYSLANNDTQDGLVERPVGSPSGEEGGLTYPSQGLVIEPKWPVETAKKGTGVTLLTPPPPPTSYPHMSSEVLLFSNQIIRCCRRTVDFQGR